MFSGTRQRIQVAARPYHCCGGSYHSSSILVGAIMMRFGNDKEPEEERDPIEQDKGFDDSSSEAQFKNKARAKRTIMYKTGLGVATVSLSIILTSCCYRNA